MCVALKCRQNVLKINVKGKSVFPFWEEGPLQMCPAEMKGGRDSSGNVTALVREGGKLCSHGSAC